MAQRKKAGLLFPANDIKYNIMWPVSNTHPPHFKPKACKACFSRSSPKEASSFFNWYKYILISNSNLQLLDFLPHYWQSGDSPNFLHVKFFTLCWTCSATLAKATVHSPLLWHSECISECQNAFLKEEMDLRSIRNWAYSHCTLVKKRFKMAYVAHCRVSVARW